MDPNPQSWFLGKGGDEFYFLDNLNTERKLCLSYLPYRTVKTLKNFQSFAWFVLGWLDVAWFGLACNLN